jgi:hypothetical protein
VIDPLIDAVGVRKPLLDLPTGPPAFGQVIPNLENLSVLVKLHTPTVDSATRLRPAGFDQPLSGYGDNFTKVDGRSEASRN